MGTDWNIHILSDHKKSFFLVLEWLHREVVERLSLEIFKIHLIMTLSDFL